MISALRFALPVIAYFLLTSCAPGRQPVTLFPANDPPARLSEWQLFAVKNNRFTLNDQVIPYDLNTPLFSDYALKLRSVWMPDGTSAGYREDRELQFPIGTILSKTFHYERAAGADDNVFRKADREANLEADGSLSLLRHQLIETRLLVHYADGWRALPYVWDESQNDAYLEVAGSQLDLSFDFAAGNAEKFTYIVPDMNQCAGCHTPAHSTKQIQPLGPKVHQLNREFSYVEGARNQLEYWSATGRLSGLDDHETASLPVSARWSDRDRTPTADLARAYLDVNCAHCHNPDGAADTSALNLHIDAEVNRDLGLCKPPVAVGRGSGDRPYDIYPGRPDDSILLFRMEHTDPAIVMPELGRAINHAEGVAVIREWIAQLPGEC